MHHSIVFVRWRQCALPSNTWFLGSTRVCSPKTTSRSVHPLLQSSHCVTNTDMYCRLGLQPCTHARDVSMGADFHSAMVAQHCSRRKTPHRAPPCEELGPSNIFFLVSLWSCLRKSTKAAATRAVLLGCNMHQIVCRLRLCHRRHWGSLQPVVYC